MASFRHRPATRPATAGTATGLVFLAVVLAVVLCSCSAEEPWNVVLITLDTTRADFLGCYGRADARTPNLDALAAAGTLFERAYSSNPVTQAAHSTILTGTYPMVHGVRDNGLFHLPPERTTLAEILADHGYATGAAVGGFPLTREFGTDQGFEFYDDDLTAAKLDQRGRPGRRHVDTWYDERPAGHVNDALFPWLRRHAAENPQQPFFLWLHYWDPHEPHIAPAPFGQLFAHDPYQGEIAYADASLGALLHVLEDLEKLDRTLVVVTADHGEGRFEHREATHAFLAYDTTLHVPLIVRPPSENEAPRGRRIEERVGTVDIVPTVLDLLGFELPADVQGRSLAPVVLGDAEPRSRDARPYYAESMSPRLTHGFGELRVLYQGPYKLIFGPRSELYRLDQDPGELHDLLAERPEEGAALEAGLRRFLDENASDKAADAVHQIGEESRRQLAALGYLSTTGESPVAVTEELRVDGAPPQNRVGDINLLSRLRRSLSRGAFQMALDTATTLVEGAPDNPYYRAKLAAAHLGLGQVDEAAAVVDATTRLTAANIPDFLAVAGALADDGRVDDAVDMAQRLLAAEESPQAQVVLGKLLLRAGDDEAFVSAMERALVLDAENAAPRLELAKYHLDSGALEAARRYVEPVLASYPSHAAALLLLARIERVEGDDQEALVHLQRVLLLAPDACDAHLEQVEILASAGRLREAGDATDFLTSRCDDETRQRVRELLANQTPQGAERTSDDD